MFIKKYGDIMVSIFFMVLSAAMMIMAKQLPKSMVMDIGPDFMPMCVGIVTFVLAMVLLVLSVKNFKMNAAEAAAAEAESADYKRVLLSFISILIYVCVLQPVGFILSTIIYLPIQMFILAPADKRDKKSMVQLLVISVIFTFAVFFLFRYGFKIVLPAGIFTINF